MCSLIEATSLNVVLEDTSDAKKPFWRQDRRVYAPDAGEIEHRIDETPGPNEFALDDDEVLALARALWAQVRLVAP